MRYSMPMLLAGIFFVFSNLANAAATTATTAAAKSMAASQSANEKAESSKEDAEAADEEAALALAAEAAAAKKAAEAAKKAADAAKAAAAAKKAQAKADAADAKKLAKAAEEAAAAAERRGASSCSEWEEERGSKVATGTATVWLSGFLSGLSTIRHQDFMAGSSDKEIFAWVDGYCAEHSLEYISDAGIHFYLEQARKKGMLP